GAREESIDIRGRDMVSGLPKTITVYSDEVEKCLRESVSLILQSAKSVLENTPPELSADIIDRGVILTGGGAMIHGIDKLLAEELKVPVLVAEEAMHCVATGTGLMLQNIDKIEKSPMIYRNSVISNKRERVSSASKLKKDTNSFVFLNCLLEFRYIGK